MNRSKIYLTLVSSLTMVVLASCVTTPPVDQGAIYYEQNMYDQAAAEWSLLADEGNYIAQHNLGGLSRNGLGNIPLNLNDSTYWFFESAKQGYVPAMVSLAEVLSELEYDPIAESWLSLAARWGSVEAIEHLRQRGLPIPEPDLYSNQQQRLKQVGDLQLPLGFPTNTQADMINNFPTNDN